MTPLYTLYRLSELSDMLILKKIWRDNEHLFGKPKQLGWPTVIAERNGKILGFISTWPKAKLITAGPLILAANSHPIVAVRLIEAYENILRVSGVTTYFFHIESENKDWMDFAERLGVMPFEETRSGQWYQRSISNGVT